MKRIGIMGGAGLGFLACQLVGVVQPAPAITNTAPEQPNGMTGSRAERRRTEKAARKEAERIAKRQRHIMGRNRYE